MNKQQISEELLLLLEANGTIIRNEPLGGQGGGLCKLKNSNIFFVDTQACSAEVADLCAKAVLKVVDIENIYIKPEIRQFIETHQD